MKLKQIILSIALLVSIGCFVIAPIASAEDCGDYSTSILPCSTGGENGINGILLLAINILTAGIGIAAVGGFIYAGVLYSSAGDSQDNIKKAKEVMKNVVIGLLAYGLMYSVLNYLIPGGVFN
jgi:hypothetical protein